MKLSSWKERLKREREQKDIFFAVHPHSPIPPIERKDFKGLDYYPPDPDYRFELKLSEYDKKERLRMVYTRGEEKEFLVWGEFRFKKDGKEQVLQAYKSSSEEERLFVPFRDATSGKEALNR